MDNVLFSQTERREEKKARREEGREKEGSKLSPFYTVKIQGRQTSTPGFPAKNHSVFPQDRTCTQRED